MNEAMIGYFEGAFLTLAIVALCLVAWFSFSPRRKAGMEEAGRIPFQTEDDDGQA
ncbi:MULTISPECIES: hypothetical protein [Devosia]|uniref:Cbb3-type cytochrome oxidase component FixQ n=1 Tax=Devosia equisanguinis TaxID=2490941 RepID=A0A447I691_9HYPH|nr:MULTISPECIES: hypothetical protein [Devosia]VDS03040.1 Cbb3-type cytochrome oxidase component FixQ [Devosia equisanguinis]